MFFKILQISLLENFSSKENTDSIMEGIGPNSRPSRLPGLKIENIHAQDNLTDWMVDRRLENNSFSTPYVHNNDLMPKTRNSLLMKKT